MACQQSKVQRHIRLQPLKIPIPQRRFSHIHVDLVGPLLNSNGFTHIFTMIDRTSRWMEAVPLVQTTAAACAKVLLSHWISRFGVPQILTSDRGSQFTSNVWFELCRMLNIRHRQTTAYHPEANGLVERLHRRLKDALKSRAAAANWSEEIHWVLLGLRAQQREDNGLSPAEAVYGSPLVLPGEFLKNDEMSIDNMCKKFTVAIDAPAFSLPRHNIPGDQLPVELPADLVNARLVWVRHDAVRRPLQRPYDGPFAVIARGPRAFTIRVGDRDEIISVARLKPCTDADAAPSTPPRRGRPPKAAATGPMPDAASRGGQPAPRAVTFSDPLAAPPSQRPPEAPPPTGQRNGFLPRGQVLVHPEPAAPSRDPQTRNSPQPRRNPPRQHHLPLRYQS